MNLYNLLITSGTYNSIQRHSGLFSQSTYLELTQVIQSSQTRTSLDCYGRSVQAESESCSHHGHPINIVAENLLIPLQRY